MDSRVAVTTSRERVGGLVCIQFLIRCSWNLPCTIDRVWRNSPARHALFETRVLEQVAAGRRSHTRTLVRVHVQGALPATYLKIVACADSVARVRDFEAIKGAVIVALGGTVALTACKCQLSSSISCGSGVLLTIFYTSKLVALGKASGGATLDSHVIEAAGY
jgi:hypothetical protein